MPLPLCRCRIALDPKFGDLAVGVGDLAEGVGTPHLRYAVRLIHGLHVHATEHCQVTTANIKLRSFCCKLSRSANVGPTLTGLHFQWLMSGAGISTQDKT